MKTYSRNEFIKFFTDRIKGEKKTYIRPPYSTGPNLFDQVCPECPGQCASICEEQIIEIAENGTPFLNFGKSGCTFCSACLDACEKGVLVAPEKKVITANIHLDFTTCLAWNSTLCQSCMNTCEVDAIFFAGLKNPNIRKDACTRCGMCIASCPVKSIEITPLSSV